AEARQQRTGEWRLEKRAEEVRGSIFLHSVLFRGRNKDAFPRRRLILLECKRLRLERCGEGVAGGAPLFLVLIPDLSSRTRWWLAIDEESRHNGESLIGDGSSIRKQH